MTKLFAILTLAVLAGVSPKAKAGDVDALQSSPDVLFKKLDTNGDGKLAASEIPKEQSKFFERLLRIGDTNKDGVLSREEFDAAMQKSEKPVTEISKTPVVDAGTGTPRSKIDPKQVFEMLDKNKDGKLTSDEVEKKPRIKAVFDRLGKHEMTLDDLTAALQDANRAKKAGKKIAKNAVKKRAKQSAKNGTLQASTSKSDKMSESSADSPHGLPAFAQLLDTNHDGRLSREELSKAVELFDKLDRNHDGVLDAKELSETPAVTSTELPAATPTAPLKLKGKKGNRMQKGNLAQVFQKADADGDGKLSREEAPPFLKKKFSKIDTNGDGFLEKSELETWVHHHRRLAAKTPNGTTPGDSTKPIEKEEGSAT